MADRQLELRAQLWAYLLDLRERSLQLDRAAGEIQKARRYLRRMGFAVCLLWLGQLDGHSWIMPVACFFFIGWTFNGIVECCRKSRV